MGTYKLWELASTRPEVYTLANQVAQDLIESGNFMRLDEWDEPSQSLVFAVHWHLFNDPRVKTLKGNHPPYTHIVQGPTVIGALRDLAPELVTAYDTHQLSRLARAVYSVLSNNDLVMRLGKSGSNSFWIRAWPPNFTPKWAAASKSVFLSQKDRRDVEKQVVKAEKLAGPVEVSHDLDLLPLPDPNPESVMAYLKKMVPLTRNLQKENDELRAQVKELEQDRDWQGVVKALEQDTPQGS